MTKIEESIELLKRLKVIQDEVYEELMAEIDAIPPLEGVQISPTSPLVAIVPFSALSGRCWSPSFYIPASQQEAIKKVIGKSGKDLGRIAKAIRNMLDQKCAKVSTYEKVYLNDESLKTLQSIYDGLKIYIEEKEKENV